MKRKILLFVALVMVLLLCMVLGGCGKTDTTPPDEPTWNDDPTEPAEIDEPTEPTEPAEPAEPEGNSGRQDGERFEETIVLEGMEEVTRYEHARNEALGFELDFEYESLERYREADGERFVSIYDDPNAPMNYLEVTYKAEDAETTAEAVATALAADFENVERQPYTLDGAGDCEQFWASGAKDGQALQTVYVIPAGDGSLVAAAHYTMESAEGFGTRFDYTLNTLGIIGK